MRTTGWRLYLGCGVLLAGVAGLLPDVAPRAARIVCYELMSAGAVAAIVVGVRWHRPPVRLPWLLFAAAQLTYFAADLTFYTYHDALGDLRFPAPADALYLGHYPLLIAGLLLLLRHRSPGRDRDGLVDALIITTGVGLLVWVFLLAPYVHATQLPPLARATSAAYPVMDLLVVAVAARLAVGGGTRPPAYWLLMVGLASLLAADALYGLAQLEGTYEIGALLDLGWLGFYVCCGAAALHPSMCSLSEAGEPAAAARLSRARLGALLSAALVAPAVLFVQVTLHRPIDGRVVAVASAGMFGLTMLRIRRLAGQVATKAERERQLHRLEAIIDASPVAIIETDPAGLVRLWNPAAERMYGWREGDVLGRPHPAGVDLAVPAQPTAGNTVRTTAQAARRQRRSDGTRIDVEISTAPLRSTTGEPAGLMSVALDVTERVRLARQLRHAAFHDPLTELANRTLLDDRLRHALARAERTDESVAVLMLDVDAFKDVNDTLGHRIGDRLLKAVAQRLADAVRSQDTVARFGGDEFVVVVEDASGSRDAVAVAQRLLHALQAPVDVAGRRVQVRASIGVVVGAADAQPEDLLRDADVAMYEAKARGGDRYRLFDPAMRKAVVERAELEEDLRHALRNDELRLRYQPIVDLASGRILGLEALVRWQHPTMGLLAPGSFIQCAEQTGLIVPLGAWVLEAACAQLDRWRSAVPAVEQLQISVNVSAQQVTRPQFASEVADILQARDIDPRRLMLELTEHLFVADVDITGSALTELHAMGVRLAMDDFGTGYSSLSYLRYLPVDVLKIDKAFVDEVAARPDAEAVVRTIVTLASTFGLTTCAEGIESPDQALRLRDLGCDWGQGYHFAAPLDDQRVVALLASRQPTPMAPAASSPRAASVAQPGPAH